MEHEMPDVRSRGHHDRGQAEAWARPAAAGVSMSGIQEPPLDGPNGKRAALTQKGGPRSTKEDILIRSN